jgi:hypothetical protein
MPPQSDVHNEKDDEINLMEAIKNFPDRDPEGYRTILHAPMCNGGVVSPTELFMSSLLPRR